jgi:hypothetical protein
LVEVTQGNELPGAKVHRLSIRRPHQGPAAVFHELERTQWAFKNWCFESDCVPKKLV